MSKKIKWFFSQEFTPGLILFLCVLIALICANTTLKDFYHYVWDIHFSIGLQDFKLSKPLHFWINDGLMAVFFFLIGLELKREFIEGELSTPQKAALPLIAALGGMLVPAGIYFLFNHGLTSASGWGIPMATDIAFAIGLLTLIGDKVPVSVKIFLTALAVADDLGAVLVIAVFYTEELSFTYLAIGLLFFAVLLLANRLGVRHIAFYVIISIFGVWLPFLFSGIHATIAGVLVAFAIPARTKVDEFAFATVLQHQLKEFENEIPNNSSLVTLPQIHIISHMKKIIDDAGTPLQKAEYFLQPWISFFIMPIFALSNAGVEIGGSFVRQLFNPVTLGIVVGLVMGKFTGVFSFTWLFVRLKLVQMPSNSKWVHIAGVSLLAGVGFTMSLFITALAFVDLQLIDQAKYGILIASFISGLLGVLLLKSIK